MARYGTKHKDREMKFGFTSFEEGLNLDVAAFMLPTTALSRCQNMKYVINTELDGSKRVVLKKRQGTTQISNTALPSAADVMACTYYVAQSKYILATASKLYYLDGTYDPVEIGSISGIPTFTEFNAKLIIHDGGRTKSWDGTTFSTINNLIADEIIETGDGAAVDFTGTLANIPVEAGTLTITFTDTTEKTITDDGAGNLIGAVSADTNTINYTTGAYSFRCNGAPDNTTSVYADYEQADLAPKSKAGLVRASRLYMWGDSDNPSRLWYSGPNDEESWDEAAGGYIDVDVNDGYDLTGCLNFYQSLVPVKENSLHRLDNFPGDTVFRVEPLQTDLGCIAYRTALNDGSLISFLSTGGWVGMSSTDQYGDITKENDLSKNFRADVAQYANSSAYSDYNQLDKQLWIALYDGSSYLPDIYVINLATGGQLSLYQFAFGHSCFKYVNGEMLIGGTDGHLYRLVDDESTFLDNGVSYASTTRFRSAFVDWKMPFNRKHNKKLICHAYGKGGITATLELYKDETYLAFDSTSLPFTTTTGDLYINPDGSDYYIYDLDGTYYINTLGSSNVVKKKFNYRNVMFQVTDIVGSEGAEFYGIDFISAVIGG